MIRLVAIDSSTWWGGVALVENESAGRPPRVAAEAGLLVEGSHAAHVLRLLEAVLAEAGWARSAVDAYATTRGPGSFTGLRVGLGTVRGLGLATGRPCYGIGTLVAMTEALGPAEGERVPLLDAGRGEVFGARYDVASSPPVEVVPPWLGPPERALSGGRGTPVVFGSGAEALAARRGDRALILKRAPTSVAAATGRLALLRFQAGARDGEGLSPLYLRPPDAEIKASGRANE